MRPLRYGISTKFILFIVLTVVLFLSVVFLAGLTLLRRHSLAEAGELASTILEETDTKVDRFFAEVEQLARGLAGCRAVYGVEPAQMQDIFVSTVLARRHYLRAIYLGTADGRMLEWGCGEGFQDHTPALPPGYDPRVRPWYRAGLESDGFTVTPPYRFASVEALGITGILPVRGSDGALVGILGLDILLDDLKELLTSLAIPKDGRAILLNEEGRIIASQYAPAPRGGLTLAAFRVRDPAELLATGSGSFISPIEGRRTFFSYKRNDRTGWIVLLGLPFEAIMAPVERVLAMMALVDALLMILLVMALGLVSRRMILRPLADIISVINRLEGGEKRLRVKVGTGDEFAILGAELNRLADTVEDYSTRLEEKVLLRTEEIARLEQENTRLRIVEEKERIYRDLHDSLGARLTNIGICNAVAIRLAGSEPNGRPVPESARLIDMLNRVETNCGQAIAGLKEIIQGREEEHRIVSDFPRIVERSIRRRLSLQRIALRAGFEGAEPLNRLSERLKTELQKVLLELVSNVLKHARASRVDLRLGLADGAVTLSFADDGAGFDYRKAERAGYGLKSIRHRVEALGGELQVATAPGKGTAWTIRVPGEAATDG